MKGRRYISVAETLREMISQKRWEVGDRLPPERALAEELDVPRGTVREALIVLEVDGLVEVRHASGIYVKSAEAQGGFNQFMPTQLGTFEMLRARMVMESAIAAEAALNVTEAQLDAMREALAEEEQDIRLRRGSYGGDEQFHHLLAEATHNEALVAVMEHMWAMRQTSEIWNRLHSRIFDDGYRRAWSADHYDILEALEQRDPESARAAMWRHLRNVSRTLLVLTDPDFDRAQANGLSRKRSTAQGEK